MHQSRPKRNAQRPAYLQDYVNQWAISSVVVSVVASVVSALTSLLEKAIIVCHFHFLQALNSVIEDSRSNQ